MISRPVVQLDPTRLRLGKDLRRQGIDPLRSSWHRVRRGVWLPPGTWAGLTTDQRYEALVFATVLACREPEQVTLAGHSAAVLWGLPSIEPWPSKTFTLEPGAVSGPSRHVHPLHGDQVTHPVILRGVKVTPVARTLIDLACIGTLDTALAAADHALRLRLCSRADLATEVSVLPARVRGRAKATLLPDLADGLSGSPGESLSRLQMFRANFARPELQRAYYDEHGLIGYVDFDHDGLIGEFDGRVKYRVPEGASPEEAGETLWREKQREDRLRRHKPVARWTWSTARSTSALARHLIGHGLKPLPRSVWFDLGSSP